MLTVNAYLTWFERKVVAHMQSRWGPHRVGPHGLLQPLADGAKFLLKEDPTPAGVDKFTYFLAPLMALALALTSIAIIPFGPNPIHVIFGQTSILGIVDLNIGILALFAITALSVYGVALAGWSSNSKYPLLGGLRSSAQMVSYELALTMSVVGVLLMAGSFSLRDIINAQARIPSAAFSAGTSCRKSSASSASSSPPSRKPIASRSIFPKPNPNSSPAFTPNTPASSSRCSSSPNTPA